VISHRTFLTDRCDLGVLKCGAGKRCASSVSQAVRRQHRAHSCVSASKAKGAPCLSAGLHSTEQGARPLGWRAWRTHPRLPQGTRTSCRALLYAASLALAMAACPSAVCSLASLSVASRCVMAILALRANAERACTPLSVCAFACVCACRCVRLLV